MAQKKQQTTQWCWEHGPFLYGTEFKFSPDVIATAVLAGFKAIDTAAQPRNCDEEAVGAGIEKAILESNGRIKRTDLWIQTKFTPIGAQSYKGVFPKPLPYDAKDPIEVKVEKSVRSSLQKLKTDYLNAVLLHEPLDTMADTLRAWTSLEKFVPATVRHIGISNAGLDVLRELCSQVVVQPSIVQSRFRLVRSTTKESYDVHLRQFCQRNSIVYQPFWVLKANPHLLKADLVVALASHFSVSQEQMLYALVASLGGQICILNGTTSVAHMKEDLEALNRIGTVPDLVVRSFEEILQKFSNEIQTQDRKEEKLDKS